MYKGEFIDGGTHDFKFTTVDTGGAPFTLAGSPVLSVYKDNDTTQTTTGVTLTEDFDGLTGCNHVRLVLTDAFYVADTDYQVVITVGTVDGVSVVGYVVAEFSIQNRGIDWGNIQRPTSTVGLSNTTVGISTLNSDMRGTDGVDTATMRGTDGVDTATMRGTDDAALATALTTAQNDLDILTGSDGATLATAQGNYAPSKAGDSMDILSISGDATAADNLELDYDGTGYAKPNSTIGTATDLTNLPSITANWLTAAGINAGAFTQSKFGSSFIQSSSFATGAINAAAIASNALEAVKFAANALDDKGNWNVDKTGYSISGTKQTLDALNDFDITAQLTQSYAADGVAPTTAQALFLIQQLLSEREVIGTTLTIYQIDGTTVAATFTLDSATNPTDQTRAT